KWSIMACQAPRLPVICIAGLAPGIYKDWQHCFLNPYSVDLRPLDVIPPPEPNSAFGKACLLVKQEIQHETTGKLRTLRERAMQQFMDEHGFQKASDVEPWKLWGAKPFSRFPCDDHFVCLSGPNGAVWLSQPYGYEPELVLGFAALHGLSVRV